MHRGAVVGNQSRDEFVKSKLQASITKKSRQNRMRDGFDILRSSTWYNGYSMYEETALTIRHVAGILADLLDYYSNTA